MSNALVANFYHPESTMLMATAAFGGYDLIMQAYNLALNNGYKFGCYGDALLVLDD
jgi:S-adenosylmethionine:tRNA ribosyltransferase-isomerase